MAEIEEGQYSLTQGRKCKFIFQLKLTDTAVKALDTYQSQGSPSKQITIAFNDKQGKIEIPGKAGTGKSVPFHFTINDLTSELLGMEHYKTSHQSTDEMRILGGVSRKMQISATSDSFKNTYNKIKQVKVNEKRSHTISQPGVTKPLKKRPRPQHSPTNQGFVHSITSTVKSDTSSSAANNGDQAGKRTRTKPKHSSAGIVTSTNQITSSTSSSLTSSDNNRSLQETIIHILMLGPQKMINIQSRVLKHHKQLDRNNLSSAVLQVATYDQIHRFYKLQSQHHSLINPEWIGYTEDEKVIIRRKKTELLTPRKQPTPRVEPSPRRHDDESTNAIQTKVRISLYQTNEKKDSPLDEPSETLLPSDYAPSDVISSSTVICDTLVDKYHPSDDVDSIASPKDETQSPPWSRDVTASSRHVNSDCEVKETSSSKGVEKKSRNSESFRKTLSVDFQMKFPEIENDETRDSYMKHGSDLETQYLKLKQKLIVYQKRFQKVLDQHEAETTSSGRNKIEKYINDQLDQLFQRSDYKADMSRYMMFHSQMLFIAKRIHDYDVMTKKLVGKDANFNVECLLVNDESQSNSLILNAYRHSKYELPDNLA